MVWNFFSGERQYRAKNSRRYPRLKANYLMRYFVVAGDEQEVIKTANTKDISLSGLRFVTRDVLEAGQMLRVHVLIPVLGDFIAVFARVEDVQKNPASQMVTVSLSFVEISQKDYERLSKFIEECGSVKEAGHLFDRFTIAKRKVQS